MSRGLRPALAAVAAAGVAAAAAAGCGGRSGLERPVRDEIVWDRWGVPHVYATTDEAVFRGLGQAQARAHGELVLRLYGEARGRAAEYWGPDGLPSDRLVRTLGVPGRAAEWVQAQSPEFGALLEAFTAGFNAWIELHPDAVSDEVRAVLPVTPEDVVAHGLRVLHYTFVAGSAPATARAWLAGEGRLGRFDPGPPESARAARLGSNGWAVSPRRSASGNALLLANPHLPWRGLFTWFEQHLVGPGYVVYGATLVGLPGVAIGFNDRLGWTHTVNTYDGADLFAVRRGEPGRYRYDGESRPFARRVEEIRVRTADGGVRTDSLEVLETVHGPVVAADGTRAVALRVAGLDAPGFFEQWWEMARARDLPSFEAALARLQIPMFNVVYADADGRVMYLFNGRVPMRSGGGPERWAGVTGGEAARDLWSETLPYDRLPRVVDPPNGWVQNANDPPWTSTVPEALEPDDYPPWLAPRFMHFRAQRSASLLASDASVEFDELLRYKHSTRMALADRILDDLVPITRSAASARVRRATRVLQAWDRTADAESRGGVLFLEWVRRWLGSADAAPGSAPESVRSRAFVEGWDPARPLSTPDGIADPRAALVALEDAAAAVEARWGALDVAWGEVHRLRRGGRDLPANGAPGDPGGVFRVTSYVDAGDRRRVAAGGDSFVAAVEFRPEGPRARSLVAYGNWSRVGSPHRGDQLELYSRKELRPVWWTRDEVERNGDLTEAIVTGFR